MEGNKRSGEDGGQLFQYPIMLQVAQAGRCVCVCVASGYPRERGLFFIVPLVALIKGVL